MHADRDGSQAPATRIVLRPLANPLPLGLVALAGASFVLSGLQLGWVEPAAGDQVAMLLLVFAVPLQAVASVLGILARDVVAGFAMGVLSVTWAATGIVLLDGAPGARSEPLGLLLVVSAVSVAMAAALAGTAKLAVGVVMALAATRFGLTAVHHLSEGGAWADAAGWLGIAISLVALYVALALALEDARHRTILPIGRRGEAEEALEAGLDAQTDALEHEAGVRAQL